MIESGELNKRVIIEQATEVQNANGEPIKTWSTYITRWASVKPLVGREAYNAAGQMDVGEISGKITLRGDPETVVISAKMRVNFNGRIFDIKSPAVVPNEYGDEVILMVKETETFISGV